QEPSATSALALEDIEVMILNRDALQIIMNQTPQLAREMDDVVEARRKAIHLAQETSI
ncbi:MAG: mechanosensitive ion channel protein, partial [Acaryochloridaceae cyanobacterium SU_2_1]|nr:mechanosensitive ion channel protein [Acaryochloridaceae cyanobacterium SU_2_1]